MSERVRSSWTSLTYKIPAEPARFLNLSTVVADCVILAIMKLIRKFNWYEEKYHRRKYSIPNRLRKGHGASVLSFFFTLKALQHKSKDIHSSLKEEECHAFTLDNAS